jgi:predicted RNase H-like HicB family nuclease
MEYVVLSFMLQPEGDHYVSKCPELGTASFGQNERKAFENLADATEVYLDTLEDLGECPRLLQETGTSVRSSASSLSHQGYWAIIVKCGLAEPDP